MIDRVRQRWQRWKSALAACETTRQRIGMPALYVALRLWSTLVNCFPVETNLRTARGFGWFWWAISAKHRLRAMENLRPSLGDRYTEGQLRKIACRSFEHFAQLYLVEVMMTPKLVSEWSWARYIELGDLEPALAQLLSDEPTIMLTPHFGNYELLGYTLARLGIPITAIMRPLDNPLVNEWLEESRRARGLRLLHKTDATKEADAILDSGEPLCFIADQDAGRKGIFAPFFGRQASWYKSIGLITVHKRVTLIVGSAARVGSGFKYRVHVERIIRPEDWKNQDDPIRWITHAFASALENLIRAAPEQYLWMHRRWKSRPKGELPAK